MSKNTVPDLSARLVPHRYHSPSVQGYCQSRHLVTTYPMNKYSYLQGISSNLIPEIVLEKTQLRPQEVYLFQMLIAGE